MTSTAVKWVSVLTGLAGLAMLGILLPVAGCDSFFKRNTIEYRVVGSASSVHIGYYGADQKYTDASDQGLPWSRNFKCDDTRRYLRIEAENVGRLGSVTVSIYANGKLLATEADTTGGYAAAWVGMYWP